MSCTDEIDRWNKGTARNIEPMPLVSIQLKKPKLGENMLNAVNDNVPGLRQTPSYFSNEKCKEAVLQSPLLPLFEVKWTTINKSYRSNPSVGLWSKENIDHGEHTDLTSCGKMYTVSWEVCKPYKSTNIKITGGNNYAI